MIGDTDRHVAELHVVPLAQVDENQQLGCPIQMRRAGFERAFFQEMRQVQDPREELRRTRRHLFGDGSVVNETDEDGDQSAHVEGKTDPLPVRQPGPTLQPAGRDIQPAAPRGHGSDGLIKLMDILRDEVESTMMLTGRGTVEAIDASLVAPMPALA